MRQSQRTLVPLRQKSGETRMGVGGVGGDGERLTAGIDRLWKPPRPLQSFGKVEAGVNVIRP